MMATDLSIVWNQGIEMWEVKDREGNVLWRGAKYVDASQFAQDYATQKGIQSGLQVQVGSARG